MAHSGGSCLAFFEDVVDGLAAHGEHPGDRGDGEPFRQGGQHLRLALGRGLSRVGCGGKGAVTGFTSTASRAAAIAPVRDDGIALMTEWAGDDLGDHAHSVSDKALRSQDINPLDTRFAPPDRLKCCRADGMIMLHAVF